ncbi:purine-nucleoside phosphorylase [candidate division WOR-3 bacterium JGI_Cruoil_03_44_89]|uniref:Purine nucleoside phosphorylase n=1 Tax=candidate division WOR-3 bacterium JGI_Cruoil_03_44_89 TaxID=1973748 RepID=A0A235BYA4_UNCW3|nr:MAG: purine-nucleoside phosphorylase [candidate division WOR-3 bacterium JGI_Cruoil_03_44_89]
MTELSREINDAVGAIRKTTDMIPQVAIILGTGLGRLVQSIDIKATISYKEIPNFPLSTVESHEGRLIFGYLSGKSVVCMQGRFHYYEGYGMKEVTFPVRVMKKLGADILIVSNATGGLNPLFERGDVMLITDHINFLPENPLRGKNDESLGPRFPDMLEVYSRDFIKLAEGVALQEKIPVRKGVYISLQGPCFETPAEYRMLRILGADAVGMSTVPEAIAARHMGMKVLGISIITDMGLPDIQEPVSHEIVIKAAEEAEPKLTKLVTAFVKAL